MRDLQGYFKESDLFSPWVEEEKERRRRESRNQRNRRRNQAVNVKIGHGGTLDPLATGVLIMGIGKGTKMLEQFLKSPKTYEAVVLFGVATDSYDRLGKITDRAPFEHITREKVVEALQKFKGKQMQTPPVFSALRVQGKHLYEYAREGEEVPEKIKERPINVYELDLLEWMESGKHSYQFPTEEEAPTEEKKSNLMEKVVDLRNAGARKGVATRGSMRIAANIATRDKATQTASGNNANANANKRKRGAKDVDEDSDSDFDIVFPSRRKVRPRYLGPEPLMSGGLPATPPTTSTAEKEGGEPTATMTSSTTQTSSNSNSADGESSPTEVKKTDTTTPFPPAIRIRMTVSSGFYVRSLCHDLGKALGSLGIMAELVRTRQGPFELKDYESTITPPQTANSEVNNDFGKDKNGMKEPVQSVLEYTDLVKGEDYWGPKVKAMLDRWNANPFVVKAEGEGENGDEQGKEKEEGGNVEKEEVVVAEGVEVEKEEAAAEEELLEKVETKENGVEKKNEGVKEEKEVKRADEEGKEGGDDDEDGEGEKDGDGEKDDVQVVVEKK